MMPSSLSRNDGESELMYIYRIGQMKDAGVIDLTWADLTDIFNRELRDPDEEYSESVYRKRYALMKQFKNELYSSMVDLADVEEMKQLKDEIQKEKKKLFDQRREYNKILASDARSEHLMDYLIRAANQLNNDYPLIKSSQSSNVYSDKEAVVCFSDWHYGMVTDNIWNKYNPEICKQRVAKFVSLAKKYMKEQHIDILHIVTLGDLPNGCIHTSARVASEEDTCDQLMHVAEILAQAISELSEVVDKTIVYSCYGNHMRSVQKKEDSIHSDNMEKIIPWWLEQRFNGSDNIEIKYSGFKEFTYLNIFGKNIVCVHGDGFGFKEIGITVNTLFTKLFGCGIDYTISGDKHHLEEFAQCGIESILVRSLCGTDNYANEKHLYDVPGQTLIIFNSDYGRECTYHIPLN